jgi:hypothetical protein
MRLTKNMRNYLPLAIPLNKPIDNLTEQEAKAYFEWFLAHIDERAEYLSVKVSSGLGIPREALDYSFESLKLVWRWFLSVAEITKTPRKYLKELKNSLKGHPRSFINHMIEVSKEELSIFSSYVLRDIGMYVGKTFALNYPKLEWTYITKPKNLISVNRPVLIGFIDDNPSYPKPFHPDFDPIAVAERCAANLFDKTHTEDDLYTWCKKWEQWV